MNLWTTCVRCGRRLWFWQRRGWYVVGPRRALEWHSSCVARRADLDEDALRALGEEIVAIIEEPRP